MARITGVVKRWDKVKGFGFINASGHAGDIFIHYRDVQQEARGRVDLEEGQAVEFDLERTHKGLAARNLTTF